MGSGFEEGKQAAFEVAAPANGAQGLAAPGGTLHATLRLGPGGRVVIPAEMREAMVLKQGDALLATLEDGELRLVTLAERVRELQSLTAKYVPEGVSLVDELLAERRAEAARED